ncbi:hypothetical protein [Klebsiella phage GZ9]|uniref:Uncharacterized protein n=1 Tax=Klebsiella phage GZ9 TaxID=2981548 RepID=A0A977XSJ0_9CAUD|nr:hypothetical protein [Klebsiella phage GZ9]
MHIYAYLLIHHKISVIFSRNKFSGFYYKKHRRSGVFIYANRCCERLALIV